jgi:hypothetical protein
MRLIFLSLPLALASLLGACVVTADLPQREPEPVFANMRGQALPPPSQDATLGQTAPPEGAAPGGIDFGQWRAADPANYGPAFERQIRARAANKTTPQLQADLEANGFACADRGGNLQCRIEIMERQCAHDWYVVLEAGRAEPVAGFDVMCLGAL